MATANTTLDFSGLTDDQLITLIREALQEAAGRTLACKSAAHAVVWDEAQKARIAQEAALREADRLKREETDRIAREAAEKVRLQKEAEEKAAQQKKVESIWQGKDEMCRRVHELLHGHTSYFVTVWNKKDKRVYIRTADADFGNNSVEYFHEGNAKTRPGHLKIYKEHEPRRAEILQFCQDLCKRWNAVEHRCDASPEATKESCTHPACVAKREEAKANV